MTRLRLRLPHLGCKGLFAYSGSSTGSFSISPVRTQLVVTSVACVGDQPDEADRVPSSEPVTRAVRREYLAAVGRGAVGARQAVVNVDPVVGGARIGEWPELGGAAPAVGEEAAPADPDLGHPRAVPYDAPVRDFNSDGSIGTMGGPAAPGRSCRGVLSVSRSPTWSGSATCVAAWAARSSNATARLPSAGPATARRTRRSCAPEHS
jgi:hypothetical protein